MSLEGKTVMIQDIIESRPVPGKADQNIRQSAINHEKLIEVLENLSDRLEKLEKKNI